MRAGSKVLQWVEAERLAVEAAQAFFEAALGPDEPSRTFTAEEVASLRAQADACYQAALAELAQQGDACVHGQGAADSANEMVAATNLLISADFVLLPTSKTVN